MKMNYFEAQGAEALLQAVPLRSLPGKAVADIAMALATLGRVGNEFHNMVSKAVEKIKPEDYDSRATKREDKIKELFPDGTPFDAKVWEEKCEDKDFEQIYNEVEEKFREIYPELGEKDTGVDVKISNDTLAAIADALCEDLDIKVGGSDMPFNVFITQMAMLAI